MKKKVNFVFIVLCILALQSCKKDYFLPNEAQCIEVKYDDKAQSLNTLEKYPFRTNPSFNPSCDDEFIFIEKVDSSSGEALILASISQQSRKILIDKSKFIGQPKIKGSKIVYVDAKGYLNIYDLLIDTSFIIAKNGFYLYPEWDSDSTLVCKYSENGFVPYYKMKITTKGEVLDKLINIPFQDGAINSNGLIATKSFSNDKILLYSSDGALLSTLISTVDGRSNFGSLCWSSTNKLIYADFANGIMEMDIESHRINKLLSGCTQNSYRTACLSTDKSDLIVERLDIHIVDSPKRHIVHESNIFFFNRVTERITKFDF